MAYTYSSTGSSGSTSTTSTSTSTSSRTASSTYTNTAESDGTNGSVTTRANAADRYSDLNLQMMIHPQKKDIIPITGDAAVKNAIRTLLLTNFMERPFQPNLGANLRSLLFEPNDAVSRLALKDAVLTVLETHEPRIENINVLIEATADETAYRAIVVFSIKENDSVQDVEINLRRLR